MADARMRALTRRAEQGDPGARRQLLAERLRAGQVTEGRLRLAAFLGDAAAADAAGARVGAEDLAAWFAAITAWEPGACARAALAAAALVEPVWAVAGGGPAVERTLEALREWTERPCPAHADAVAVARLDLRAAGIGGAHPRLAAHAGRAAHCADLAAQLADPDVTGAALAAPTHEALSRAAQVPPEVIDAAAAWRSCPCDAHRRAVLQACPAPGGDTLGDYLLRLRGAGSARVRQAVREAVVPWALGLEAVPA